MKKISAALLIILGISTILFFACNKNLENPGTEQPAFITEAKNWFNTVFVNSPGYKNGTANGNFKVPDWKYGRVYKIGNTDVAEFPLSAARKKVYIAEQLSEADSRRVIDGTKINVLFIKAPGKQMEVRIIQFTPTFEYLKSKNFNVSSLSFKDYTKDFKGDFMMFDFDNNLTKGYHFGKDGVKNITLRTKYSNSVNAKTVNNTNSSNLPTDLCDNISDVDPNCVYIVHTTYEVVCNGNWDPSEGFNPQYCHIEIVSIYCELSYCNGDGGGMEDCMNQGYTQEECLCSLYGLCGGGGGDCDPSAIAEMQNQFNDYCQNTATPATVSAALTQPQSDPIVGTQSWKVTEGLTWYVEALTDYKYYHHSYALYPHEYDLFYFNTFSTNFMGTNMIWETIWTQTNSNSQNKDVVYNNNTGACKGVATVIGKLDHKSKLGTIVVPGCPIPIPGSVFSRTDDVNNSLTLFPK